MSRTTMSGGWALVATAPRDGTPVILWLAEEDTAPEQPRAVGYGPSTLGLASATGGSLAILRASALTDTFVAGNRFSTVEIITANFAYHAVWNRLDPTRAPAQQVWNNPTSHWPITARRMDAFPANTRPGA